MKNKKSSVPVTILVIGVFLVCSYALLTFFISDFKISNSFIVVTLVREANIQIDEYLFYKNSGVSLEKIDKYFDEISFDSNFNSLVLKKEFYDFRTVPKFDLDWKEEYLVFEMKYFLP